MPHKAIVAVGRDTFRSLARHREFSRTSWRRRRASTYLPNPRRADLQSAVWNRRFGICIENLLKQFSKGMIAKAVENPAVYIQIGDSKLLIADPPFLGSASMLIPRRRSAPAQRPEADLSGRRNVSCLQSPRRRKLRT